MMKSDISRKQPPIAAFSEEPVKTYPDMSTKDRKGQSVRAENGPFRVSGEIISAIRRQRGTSGVDYWKPHTATLPPTCHAKRTTFQNLFFPSLDMSGLSSGNTGRIIRGRSDGTDSKPGLPQFSRSHTVSGMTLPGVGNRARDSSFHPHVEAKKVVVTDLTCLELGDSVDPNKSPKLAYFYQLYQAKFRYTDYFEEGSTGKGESDMPLKPISVNGQDVDRVQQFHPRKPIKLNPSMRTMSLPSMNPHRRGSQDHVRVPIHGNTVAVRGGSNRRQDANGLYMDVFSRRPPVKYAMSEGVGSGARTEGRDLAIKGTVFSINNVNSRSHRPSSVSRATHPEQKRTVRSASIPRAHLRKTDPMERTRKRSVHFSVANEVYEYAPTDPVKN